MRLRGVDTQPQTYRNAALGSAQGIPVEAASTFGWTCYVDNEVDVIGMASFGVSAPDDVLFEKLSVTKSAIIASENVQLGHEKGQVYGCFSSIRLTYPKSTSLTIMGCWTVSQPTRQSSVRLRAIR